MGSRKSTRKAEEIRGRVVVDVETGATTIVPFTAEELAAREAEEAAALARIAEEEKLATNEGTLRDRATGALEQLEAAWAGWANLTAAQKDAALKLNVRVTIAIVRLVLRRLDKT